MASCSGTVELAEQAYIQEFDGKTIEMAFKESPLPLFASGRHMPSASGQNVNYLFGI